MKKQVGRKPRATIEGPRSIRIRRLVLGLLLHSALTLEDLTDLLSPLNELLKPLNLTSGMEHASIMGDVQLRRLLDPQTRAKIARTPIDAIRGILYELCYDHLATGDESALNAAIAAALEDAARDEPKNQRSLFTALKGAPLGWGGTYRFPDDTAIKNAQRFSEAGKYRDLFKGDKTVFFLVPRFLRRYLHVYLTQLRYHAKRKFRAVLHARRRDIAAAVKAALPPTQFQPSSTKFVQVQTQKLDSVADLYAVTGGTVAKLRREAARTSLSPISPAEVTIQQRIVGRRADGSLVPTTRKPTKKGTT